MAQEKTGPSRKTILKKRVKTDFAHIPNATLQDSKLSWKSTGLLAYLLSLPDDWQINLVDLSKRKIDGRDSTRSAVRDLENAGYMRITVLRNGGTGRFADTIWEVSATADFSVRAPCSENPDPAKPLQENPVTGNSPQESTQHKVSLKKEKNYNNESDKNNSDFPLIGEASCSDDSSEPHHAKGDTGAIGREYLDIEPLRQLGDDVLPAETLSLLIDLVLTTNSPQAYLDLVADAFAASSRRPPAMPVKWLTSVISSPGGGDLTQAYQFRKKVTKARRNEAERKSREKLPPIKSGECQAAQEMAIATGKKLLDAIKERCRNSKSL